jgi:hypothetical protein
MTTLTREQIERAREELPLALGRESITSVNALCNLALIGRDVIPRPIEDVHGDIGELIVRHIATGTWRNAYWKDEFGWYEDCNNTPLRREAYDLFIPLSSLPKVPTP